jgi:hypothetical protein
LIWLAEGTAPAALTSSALAQPRREGAKLIQALALRSRRDGAARELGDRVQRRCADVRQQDCALGPENRRPRTRHVAADGLDRRLRQARGAFVPPEVERAAGGQRCARKDELELGGDRPVAVQRIQVDGSAGASVTFNGRLSRLSVSCVRLWHGRSYAERLGWRSAPSFNQPTLCFTTVVICAEQDHRTFTRCLPVVNDP